MQVLYKIPADTTGLLSDLVSSGLGEPNSTRQESGKTHAVQEETSQLMRNNYMTKTVQVPGAPEQRSSRRPRGEARYLPPGKDITSAVLEKHKTAGGSNTRCLVKTRQVSLRAEPRCDGRGAAATWPRSCWPDQPGPQGTCMCPLRGSLTSSPVDFPPLGIKYFLVGEALCAEHCGPMNALGLFPTICTT